MADGFWSWYSVGPAKVEIHDKKQASTDAAFVAAARTALPEALDEIERLRSALERIASCTFENGEDIDDIQRWSRAALEGK